MTTGCSTALAGKDQLYAGLAILARDTHTYLMQFPEQKVVLFEEVISSVSAEEQELYDRYFGLGNGYSGRFC